MYLDECKEAPFLLVGVCIHDRDKAALRKALGSLPLKGQRSIHFKHESSRRKRFYLGQFVRLGFNATVFRVKGIQGIEARRLSIREVVRFARDKRVNQLIFDLDETAKVHDERLLASTVSLVRGKREFQWEHRERHQEPLLWVADAVAWCVNRGGEWERLVRPLIVETIDC